MNDDLQFQSFPKLARLSRECWISEKIDGTNAQVFITSVPFPNPEPAAVIGDLRIYAGSRNRWISPQSDNYGFAGWVRDHAEELVGLGEGQHFGEWWGNGIQRNYGLLEKRFSLFNARRWCEAGCAPLTFPNANPAQPAFEQQIVPACCHVVPVLYRGEFRTSAVDHFLEELRKNGSVAAPPFPNPEGVVVYHVAGNVMFKKTIENDASPKGLL